jgi:hypothetical protein
VATKVHKRYAKGLIEGLESRVHVGPPIGGNEIASARQFLQQSEFSPASDYFSRLSQIQNRLGTRSHDPALPRTKRNYGGEAAGFWMQLQSAYDHVILSTCYEGEFNLKRGRVKISHRFNQRGRIDFVELKFLKSLQNRLNGEIRKLLIVKSYRELRMDWRAAEAFVLEVLPQELIFLYQDIFRCPKSDLYAWLVNIGHRLVNDLVRELSGGLKANATPSPQQSDQLCLAAVRADEVALPILERAASLESTVEIGDPKNVVVRYHGG